MALESRNTETAREATGKAQKHPDPTRKKPSRGKIAVERKGDMTESWTEARQDHRAVPHSLLVLLLSIMEVWSLGIYHRREDGGGIRLRLMKQ